MILCYILYDITYIYIYIILYIIYYILYIIYYILYIIYYILYIILYIYILYIIRLQLHWQPGQCRLRSHLGEAPVLEAVEMAKAALKKERKLQIPACWPKSRDRCSPLA